MQENNAGKGNQSGLSWSTPSQNQGTTSNAQPNKEAKPQAPTKASPAPAAAATNGSSAGKYVGMVVVGILAGVIVAWGWNAMRSSSSDTTSNATSTTKTTGVAKNDSKSLGIDTSSVALGSDPGLTLMSPQPAGNSVAITKAIVSEPTWVVVYEDQNGKPGNALGAALFFPEKQGGTVELLRPTIAGKNYLAVKAVDNGDRKFSLKDDQPLSENGEVQWVTFQAN